MAIELNAERLTNPMVNSGALATTSLAPGATTRRSGVSSTRGFRALPAARSPLTGGLHLGVRDEPSQSRHRRLLWSYDRLYFDRSRRPTLHQQCSPTSAPGSGGHGGDLANGGVNPLTAIMWSTRRLSARAGCDGRCGLYETRATGSMPLGAREERNRRWDRHRRTVRAAWAPSPSAGRRGNSVKDNSRRGSSLSAGAESLHPSRLSSQAVTEQGNRSSSYTRFGPELEERFTRYARIDTQSDESSATTPSTAQQFDLLNLW